ncbi:hypothetical protein BKA70DRAFT_1218344 [Coprinopsis sp. MPI-PUGE-AT-0042]|nr:hypothetical protein BKA70DRAFT_1218344 [Coprinopsis sp. MPI-PUGE-AT-0042]
MSTVDALSYSSSKCQQNRDAATSGVLEKYHKVEVGPTTSKHDVRYPVRSRFVSDFILVKTGKARTAKQISSQVQQLRDTCKDVSSLLGKSGTQELECKAETSPATSLGGRQLSNSPTPPPEETMVICVQLECPGIALLFIKNDQQSARTTFFLTKQVGDGSGIFCQCRKITLDNCHITVTNWAGVSRSSHPVRDDELLPTTAIHSGAAVQTRFGLAAIAADRRAAVVTTVVLLFVEFTLW